MRIILEDAALEKAAMDGEMCIAVPVEAAVYGSGEKTVTVYPAFEKLAEKFASEYGNEPFSDGAKNFIKCGLEVAMDNAGYEADDGGNGHLIYFFADINTKIKKREIDAEIVLISKNTDFDKYIVPDGMVAEVDDEDGADVYFAAVVNGRIAAYAGVNDLSDDGSLEINVETVKAFRKKGYGSAVAAALTEYLVSGGERVVYCCNVSNTASVKLARSIGLAFEKKSFSFVYYLKSDE